MRLVNVTLYMDLPDNLADIRTWFCSATNIPSDQVLEGWTRYKIDVQIPMRDIVEVQAAIEQKGI